MGGKKQNKKRMGFVLMLVLVCAWGLFGEFPAAAAVKEESSAFLLADNLTAGKTIVCGNGLEAVVDVSRPVRYGRNYLFTAELTNAGTDITGRIEWLLIDGEGENLAYQQEFCLQTGEKKRLSMTVPFHRYTKRVLVRLAKENGEVFAEEELEIKPVTIAGRMLVGVVGEENGLYDGVFGSLWYTFPEEELPEDVEGLDVFDLLYLKEVQLSALNRAQTEALVSFVRRGGTLFMTCTEDGRKTLEQLSSLFMPILVEEGESKKSGLSQEELLQLKQAVAAYESEREQLYTYYPDGLTARYPGAAMSLADGELPEGTPAFFVQGKEPDGVVALPYGDGMLEVVPYALELTGQEENVTLVQLLYQIFERVSQTKKEQLQTEYNGWDEKSTLYYIATDLEEKRTPELLPMLLVLAAHVLLVGPGLYFLLRVKDRHRYLWSGVALLATAGSVLMIVIGQTTRIKRPYVQYVSVCKADLEGNRENELYLSVAAPTNKRVTVSLETDGSVTSGLRNVTEYYFVQPQGAFLPMTWGRDTYTRAVRYGMENTVELELQGVPAFTEVPYFISYKSAGEPAVTAKLSLTEEGVSGTVYENTEHMDGAFVYDSGFLYRLDRTEEAKGKLSVGAGYFLVQENSLYGTKFETVFYGKKVAEEERDYTKETLLAYCVEQLQDEAEPYVICFLEEKEEGQELFKEEGFSYDLTGERFVIMQQVEREKNKDSVFVPSLGTGTVIEGECNSYGYLNSLPFVADYVLPAKETVTELLYSQNMNQPYEYSTGIGFDGDIYFYNWNTEKYDLIFSGDGYGSLRQIAAYLNESGCLRVKLTKGNSYADGRMTMPHLSYRKEASE